MIPRQIKFKIQNIGNLKLRIKHSGYKWHVSDEVILIESQLMIVIPHLFNIKDTGHVNNITSILVDIVKKPINSKSKELFDVYITFIINNLVNKISKDDAILTFIKKRFYSIFLNILSKYKEEIGSKELSNLLMSNKERLEFFLTNINLISLSSQTLILYKTLFDISDEFSVYLVDINALTTNNIELYYLKDFLRRNIFPNKKSCKLVANHYINLAKKQMISYYAEKESLASFIKTDAIGFDKNLMKEINKICMLE